MVMSAERDTSADDIDVACGDFNGLVTGVAV